MADGERAAFDEVVAAHAVNREDAVEPPACRVGGPEGFHATALWLRAAFADLRHEVRHVVVEGDLVVVDTVMSGRHVGQGMQLGWVPPTPAYLFRCARARRRAVRAAATATP